MPLVIRTTTKRVRVMYVLSVVVLAAMAYLAYQPPHYYWIALAAGAAPLLVTAKRHIALRLTTLTVDQHFLRYQSGLISKTTRTVEAHKVQDVRVDQNLLQRLLRTGNLSIETAGSNSRLAIPDIDHPHDVAAQILKLSSKGQPES